MFNRSILFYEASMPANYSTGKTYTYKSKIVSGTPILTNTATPVATPTTPVTQTVTQTPGWLKRNYGKAITVGTLSALTGGGVITKNYIEDKDDQSRKERSDEIDKNFKNVMATRATAKVVDVSPEVKPPTEVSPVVTSEKPKTEILPGSINQGTNIALGIGAGIGALALARKLRKKKTNLKEI